MPKYDDTILVLNDREKVRDRPGVYIGDDGETGLATIIREIFDNAVDEYPHYPDPEQPIDVILHSDESITVRDYGRGISPYQSQKYPGKIAERLAYTLLGAGGKMKSNREANGSEFSGGLNGMGAAATNFMSEYFDVTIWRDGEIFHDRFENGGEPVIKLKNGNLPHEKQKGKLQTGTQIHFKPDATVLNAIHPDVPRMETIFQDTAYLTPRLHINWTNERDGQDTVTYYSEKRPYELLDKMMDDDRTPAPLLVKPFEIEGDQVVEVRKQKIHMHANVFIAFSKNDTGMTMAYTNKIYNRDGGTHVNGLDAGLLKLVRHYYQEFQSEFQSKYKKQIDIINKVYKTKDPLAKLRSRDLSRMTYVVLDFKHSDPILSPQTKDKLGSSEAKKAMEEIVYEKAIFYLDKNIQAVQQLIGFLIKALAERAKDDDENVKIDKKTAKLSVSTKLAAARHTRPGKGAELIIVEGDSAAGTIKENRDSNFQAVLPLRGKVLNVQKQTLAKALRNMEITTLFSVLEARFGKNFNINKLAYDKIIICTDQDTDGGHIAVLLQTLFLKYMPEVLTDGHVYRLETPLFVNKMKAKNAKDQYTYSNQQQEEFLAKNRAKVAKVERNKGLGELDIHEIETTILDANSRHLSPIHVDDLEEAEDLVDNLMGSSSQGRKQMFLEGE